MPKDPQSDNESMQRILDNLVSAGWLEHAALIDSAANQRGKVKVKLTSYGAAMLHRFKDVHDRLGDFDDADRHALYELLIEWIRDSPAEFGIDPESV